MKKKLLSLILSTSMVAAILAGSATAEEAFNPDTETDTIPYDQLEEKFGSIADLELPEEISMGGILKNQANEFWLALGEGMTS